MAGRSPHVRDRNLLLAALSSEEYERLRPNLEAVSLEENAVLIEPFKPIRYVYFPVSGAVALVMPTDGGHHIEAGMVGNEGMAGVCLSLGSNRAPMRAVLQTSSRGMKMKAAAFQAEMERNGPLAQAVRRYAQGYLVMLSQGLVCIQTHRIEQRCARWLLMLQDRVNTDSFRLTHQTLARMLGVRRASVSEAASRLQSRGLVNYERGVMTIVDRAGLERVACECYRVIRKEMAHLLALSARAGR